MNFFFVLLIVAPLLDTTGSVEQQLPSFQWVSDEIPHMKIVFPKGEEDSAFFEAYNPFQDLELQNVPCIFRGVLLNETKARLTITGRCLTIDNFDVQIQSYRLKESLYRVVNGKTEIVMSPLGQDVAGDIIKDVQVQSHLFSSLKNSSKTQHSLPNEGFVLKISILYDKNWMKKFGNESESLNSILRVMAHVQAMFRWPSLSVPIILEIDSISYQNVLFTVDAAGLKVLGRYTGDSDINSFLGLTSSSGHVGITTMYGTCGPPKTRTSVASAGNWSDIQMALIVVHDLAHSLGMPHDFLDPFANPKKIRKDSQGRSCTNIGGVLDYRVSSKNWTTCSVQKLTEYYKDVIDFRGQFCLQTIPKVTLVGGNSQNEGTVYAENPSTGIYGPVCDDEFDIVDASIICKQLGFIGAQSFSCCSQYGEVETSFSYTDLKCKGNENHIGQCPHLDVHNCQSSEGAGVVCIQSLQDANWEPWSSFGPCSQTCGNGTRTRTRQCKNILGVITEQACEGPSTETIGCSQAECKQTNIVLVGGKGDYEGNVYARHPLTGIYGPVCDDNFDFDAANVICRQMGYEKAVSISCCSNYGPVSEDFSYDDVDCIGNETSLDLCDHDVNSDCRTDEGAGVRCKTDVPTPAVALVGSTVDYEGIVYATDPDTEIFGPVNFRSEFTYSGTTPPNNYSKNAADIVCRQLGFHGALLYSTDRYPLLGAGFNYINQKTPFSISNTVCLLGNESTLYNCSFISSGLKSLDDIFNIFGPILIGNRGLRIQCNTSSATPIDGVMSQWSHYGPSCSRACGQGGYRYTFRNCESPYPYKGGDNCCGNYWRDSSCNTQPCPTITLINGRRSNDGYVLVNGGFVSDDLFDIVDAHVICRQLNFSEAVGFSSAMEHFKSLPYHSCSFGDLKCFGNETSIDKCPNTPNPFCSQYEAVRVICKHNSSSQIDGDWGSWGPFGECSRSCGGGIQIRYRLCNNPTPQNGGRKCFGSKNEATKCKIQNCIPELSKGQVMLLVGGGDYGDYRAEIYSPTGGCKMQVNLNMGFGYYYHRTTFVHIDGLVFVCYFWYPFVCFKYNTEKNSWTILTSTNFKHSNSLTTGVYSNKFYVFDNSNPEVYDPQSNTWTTWPKPSYQLYNLGCMVQWKESFLVYGFKTVDNNGVDVLLQFNQTTQTWSEVFTNSSRNFNRPTCFILPNDNLFITNSEFYGIIEVIKPYIFNPITKTWLNTTRTSLVYRDPVLVSTGNRIYAFGSTNDTTPEEYNYVSNTWSIVPHKTVYDYSVIVPPVVFANSRSLALPAELFENIPGGCTGFKP